MKKIATVSAVALSLSLGACAQGTGPELNKQTAGTVLGGVGGAVIGSQFGSGRGQLAATAAGTLLGAFVGSEVGRSLDRADRIEAERTAVRSLETGQTGQTSTWSNPDSGHSGSFTPTRTYETAEGRPCREYRTTVVVDGRTETGYGTACRQSDGTWQIVS